MTVRRKLTLVGDAGVGKTAIVNCRSGASPSPTPTVLLARRVIVDPASSIELEILDTAGQERYRAYLPVYLRGADVVLLVFDRANAATFLSVREWLAVVRGTADPQTVLVANKCDLPAAVDEGAIQALSEELRFAATFFTSAVSGSGIDALFMWVFQTLAALDGPAGPVWSPPGAIEQTSKRQCEGGCAV
jgi:small GTP-binding protein